MGSVLWKVVVMLEEEGEITVPMSEFREEWSFWWVVPYRERTPPVIDAASGQTDIR